MPLYFIFFLAMLGASVLLFVGALLRAAFARGKPPPRLLGAAAADIVQALGLALLWINFGVGWLLYFNVYQIHVDMGAIGNEAFQAFTRGYTRRLPIVVLPFGAACLAWALSLWGEPGRYSRRALWAITALCLLSIASTPWAAGAQGDMQEQGFTQAAYEQLQAAHLVRSLAISAAAVWALVKGWRRAGS
ncbi:hypothetical protein SNE35_25315 [Paucibacter sp. R3-3]|uniref:DUF1772 domain-containing protein n=1 Tax=Roseateles agri TaxID=3098619 RepID=A0ABU5DNF8_9BURK|nr:hypothetical protein [Paucibacter sp. R3-3]MDY0747847.1 hypothetical protein [Paucibacter sp. R3-3]